MVYYVLFEDKIVCFYCGEDKSIYRREYTDGKWSRAVCVASDVRNCYSVMNNSELICQETLGNIILCRQKDGNWHCDTVLEGKGNYPPDMLMNRIGEAVVYCLPNGRDRTLVLQKQKDGKWTQSSLIDGFVPFHGFLYRTVPLSDGRVILVYRKNSARQELGFRMIDKNGDMGAFTRVYTSSGLITDCSFAEDNGTLYFLFIVKGRLSSKLMYAHLQSDGAFKNGQPLVLWEGGNTDCACIRRKNGKTVTEHVSGGRIYTFEGGEYGFKSGGIKRTPYTFKKAAVINARGMSDIIVPKDRPYDADISIFLK